MCGPFRQFFIQSLEKRYKKQYCIQMGNIILEFKQLYFQWANGLALNDINLKIPQSSYTLITGPSGSGKSTLLRLACRLEEPQKGEIFYNGESLRNIQPQYLRRKIALIQQTPTIIDGSLRDNLLLPYSFTVNKNSEKPSDEILKNKMKELFLNVDLNKEASSLSVGQKQRLCIIRTLLLAPDILLMDEPTSALDPESKSIVENISEELNKNGMTIMTVSHSEYKPKVPFTHLFVKDGSYEALS